MPKIRKAKEPKARLSRERIKAIAKDFRDGIVGEHSSAYRCLLVCSPLQGFLDFLGVKTQLREGWFRKVSGAGRINHVWLEMEDGGIIDPTADQFSKPSRPMPPVYVGDRPAWYRVRVRK